MRVPKILYHGTTKLRWEFIKKDGLLRSDLSKAIEAEELLAWNTGYVYLCSDLNDAVRYGLHKSLQDSSYLDIPENMKLNPNYRDPVVLSINAAKLGDKLELDPESLSYRYKGDIKLKHICTHKHVPFDIFDSNLIDKLQTVNENRDRAWQTMMNRSTNKKK
jgi:hypothetical protein